MDNDLELELEGAVCSASKTFGQSLILMAKIVECSGKVIASRRQSISIVSDLVDKELLDELAGYQQELKGLKA